MKTKSFRYFCLVFLFFIFFSGCSKHVLPSSEKTIKSPWPNYDKASIDYGKIIENETTIKGLKKLGIDPYKTPNIKILTYTDIVSLFLGNRSIKKDDLEEGVRKCLDAKNGCQGLSLAPMLIKEDRKKGNVFLDALRFKRMYHKTGWEFKGLILIVNGVVVYKERAGGTPLIDEERKEVQPFGPLQDPNGLIRSLI